MLSQPHEDTVRRWLSTGSGRVFTGAELAGSSILDFASRGTVRRINFLHGSPQALMSSGSKFYTDRYFAHANQIVSPREPSLNRKKAGLCSEPLAVWRVTAQDPGGRAAGGARTSRHPAPSPHTSCSMGNAQGSQKCTRREEVGQRNPESSGSGC